MKRLSVDKSKFLAVAAALAGVAAFQACTVVNETRDMGSAGQSSEGGDDGGGKSPIAGSTSQAGEGGAAKGGEGGATQGGESVGGAGEAAGGAAAGAAGAGGAGGAAACEEAVVALPKCDNVTAECTPYCNAAIANLKTAIAAKAISCLEADKSGNCDAGYGCLSAATHDACPEDVAAACTAAVTNCGEPDVGDPPCAELLSGFTDAARADVIKCTTEQGCFGVYSCAEGFFFQ